MFPSSLTLSINKIIPGNIPRVGMSFDDSLEWSKKYNNIPYRSTLFHKCPLLAMSSDVTDLLISDPKTCITINRYEKSVLISKLVEMMTPGQTLCCTKSQDYVFQKGIKIGLEFYHFHIFLIHIFLIEIIDLNRNRNDASWPRIIF